ncbi:MAG: hypothetical protein GQ468_05405 [Candidatus Scalindua sp.]|nr:hypothetical protein [Candidatus Scalindua sp.]
MYAVRMVGANSNLGDVVNVNQVSIRTANSAGLIGLGDINTQINDIPADVWNYTLP